MMEFQFYHLIQVVFTFTGSPMYATAWDNSHVQGKDKVIYLL